MNFVLCGQRKGLCVHETDLFVVAALLSATYFIGYSGALPLYAELFGLCSALFGRIYIFTCAAVDFMAAAPVQSIF